MVMSNLPRFAAGVLLSLTLAGCANADLGPKQTMGTLLGAGTGALIGAQFGHGTGQLVATSVGTLLGAYLGNEAGKPLDRADALYASRAEYQALEHSPSGSFIPWSNPDSGHYGRVTPIETYESTEGAYRREFQHQAQIGGRTHDAYGTACRTVDGQWQVVH
jgi:surface antigen